jgi:hypothetical protein
MGTASEEVLVLKTLTDGTPFMVEGIVRPVPGVGLVINDRDDPPYGEPLVRRVMTSEQARHLARCLLTCADVADGATICRIVPPARRPTIDVTLDSNSPSHSNEDEVVDAVKAARRRGRDI